MVHTLKICLFAHYVTRAFLTGYILSIKHNLGALFSLTVHFTFAYIQVYGILQLNFNCCCRVNSRKKLQHKWSLLTFDDTAHFIY